MRRRVAVIVVGGVALCVCAAASTPREVRASAQPVIVFPIPGSHVASPRSQIVVRGLPVGQLGAITVTGSRSGLHSGVVRADSDGLGGSFLPSTPFTAGETVTVSTSLNVVGGSYGSWRFTIATPAGGIPPLHWPVATRARGDVQRFHSRPDLVPPTVAISKRLSRTAPGDIFLAPQFGPVQTGPMIVDSNGSLIWFDPMQGVGSASDLRVQTFRGQPVLTWWQGYVTAGVGVGQDVIADSSYRVIATVQAVGGIHADLHEFELTPRGTGLIAAAYPVIWDTSSVHGSRREIVFDSVVQEIDIATGLLLFQWDSLDHVPVTESYAPPPAHTTSPFDYFHLNSIELDNDGNLIVSARNTWAAYKISPLTGAVIWRLGGKRSSFKLAPGVYWAFQHDVRVRANDDRYVTLFDDSAGPPTVHAQSRGIKLLLDTRRMTATLVTQYVHAPSLSANYEGNLQQLPGGDDFLGWGQEPYFTEFSPAGTLLFDGRFVGGNASYRAYRFSWTGQPATPPALAASTTKRTTTVYASWNGATSIAAWRVLGGTTPAALRPIATARKRGFETAITVPSQQFVAVQALDAAGHALSQSATVRAG